jgi:hypothetical protein
VAAQLGPGDSVLQFPEEIRKVIYTTNAVESLYMSLRKVTKNCGVHIDRTVHTGGDHRAGRCALGVSSLEVIMP